MELFNGYRKTIPRFIKVRKLKNSWKNLEFSYWISRQEAQIWILLKTEIALNTHCCNKTRPTLFLRRVNILLLIFTIVLYPPRIIELIINLFVHTSLSKLFKIIVLSLWINRLILFICYYGIYFIKLNKYIFTYLHNICYVNFHFHNTNYAFYFS